MEQYGFIFFETTWRAGNASQKNDAEAWAVVLGSLLAPTIRKRHWIGSLPTLSVVLLNQIRSTPGDVEDMWVVHLTGHGDNIARDRLYLYRIILELSTLEALAFSCFVTTTGHEDEELGLADDYSDASSDYFDGPSTSDDKRNRLLGGQFMLYRGSVHEVPPAPEGMMSETDRFRHIMNRIRPGLTPSSNAQKRTQELFRRIRIFGSDLNLYIEPLRMKYGLEAIDIYPWLNPSGVEAPPTALISLCGNSHVWAAVNRKVAQILCAVPELVTLALKASTTDPQTNKFSLRNLDFHFEADRESVMVPIEASNELLGQLLHTPNKRIPSEFLKRFWAVPRVKVHAGQEIELTESEQDSSVNPDMIDAISLGCRVSFGLACWFAKRDPHEIESLLCWSDLKIPWGQVRQPSSTQLSNDWATSRKRAVYKLHRMNREIWLNEAEAWLDSRTAMFECLWETSGDLTEGSSSYPEKWPAVQDRRPLLQLLDRFLCRDTNVANLVSEDVSVERWSVSAGPLDPHDVREIEKFFIGGDKRLAQIYKAFSEGGDVAGEIAAEFGVDSTKTARAHAQTSERAADESGVNSDSSDGEEADPQAEVERLRKAFANLGLGKMFEQEMRLLNGSDDKSDETDGEEWESDDEDIRVLEKIYDKELFGTKEGQGGSSVDAATRLEIETTWMDNLKLSLDMERPSAVGAASMLFANAAQKKVVVIDSKNEPAAG